MPEHDLTTKDIAEFIAIWAEEFNEILTEAEARAEATKLLELYQLLVQPLPAGSDSQTSRE